MVLFQTTCKKQKECRKSIKLRSSFYLSMPGGDRQDPEFQAHRQLKADAAKQGLEVSQTRHQTTQQSDQLVTQSKVSSRGLREARERERQEAESAAKTEAEFAAFKQAKEAGARQGYDVSSVKVRSNVEGDTVKSRVESAKFQDNLKVGSLSRQQAAAQYQNAPISRSITKMEDRPIVESDDAIMTPARGIRSRSVYEGFYEAGGKQTVVIGTPKTERVAVDLPPPPNDFFEGIKENVKNLGIDFELGGKGIGYGIGSIFSFGNQKAQKNIISQAEKEGRIAESKTGRELEREFVGSAIESGISTAQGKPSVDGFGKLGKDIMASPLFFAGSGVASAAVYLTPYGISKAFRFFSGAAKVAPRARFDYNPVLGSFADRPSVRFGPYNPTRWENPEALAELSKFKMSVDMPKAIKIAPLATSVRTAEAFESVRGRQDVIVQSRGGSLILKPEPLSTSVKVEPLGLQVAKQTASRAESVSANIRKNWIAPTVPLGFMGDTGVNRRKRRDTSMFSTELETVAFPKNSQAEKIFGKVGDASSFQASQRDLTSQFSKVNTNTGLMQSNRTDLLQRSNLNTILREMQQTATMQTALTAQMTKQLTQQVTGLTTRTTVKTTWTPDFPKITIPPFDDYGFGRPMTKKGKKGRKGRATPREGQIKDLVSVALGDSNKIAKQFRKTFGRAF